MLFFRLVAFVFKVERGGSKQTPQAYIKVRRGWLRSCQQSYTKNTKLLLEFFFYSLHCFF